MRLENFSPGELSVQTYTSEFHLLWTQAGVIEDEQHILGSYTNGLKEAIHTKMAFQRLITMGEVEDASTTIETKLAQ